MHLAPMLQSLAHKIGPSPSSMGRKPMLRMPHMMDEDAYMLCKVLDSTAAQAIELKKKIKMGKKLPSWAEYKVYIGANGIKSALSSTYTMADHMPKLTIAIKPGPSMGTALSSSMQKHAAKSKTLSESVKFLREAFQRKMAGKASSASKTMTSGMNRRQALNLMGSGVTMLSPTARLVKGLAKSNSARKRLNAMKAM